MTSDSFGIDSSISRFQRSEVLADGYLGRWPRLEPSRSLSAESAEYDLIPNVALIINNLVELEELAIFILKRGVPVMLFLTTNVALKSSYVRLAD